MLLAFSRGVCHVVVKLLAALLERFQSRAHVGQVLLRARDFRARDALLNLREKMPLLVLRLFNLLRQIRRRACKNETTSYS